MSILPLVIAPDPFLNEVSAPVEIVDESIRNLLNDMVETMYDSKGVGLAAVQIGQHKRVIVVDTEYDPEKPETRKPIKLVNAEIIEKADALNQYVEGCLSFPEQYSEVDRPETVTVKYLDENGKTQTLAADGLLATCLQHEIDHMNGITFVQHISRLKRDRILKKLSKMRKQGAFDTHDCGDPACDLVH